MAAQIPDEKYIVSICKEMFLKKEHPGPDPIKLFYQRQLKLR